MNKILKDLNISRLIYLAGGIFLVLVSLFDRSWWLFPIGVYFAAMAIFRFGCAKKNCEIILEQRKNSD